MTNTARQQQKESEKQERRYEQNKNLPKIIQNLKQKVADGEEAASSRYELDLTARAPSRSATKYRAPFSRLLNARRFGGMFSDGHGRTMIDRRGLRHDTDVCAWERRWASLRLWCVGTISPA